MWWGTYLKAYYQVFWDSEMIIDSVNDGSLSSRASHYSIPVLRASLIGWPAAVTHSFVA